MKHYCHYFNSRPIPVIALNRAHCPRWVDFGSSGRLLHGVAGLMKGAAKKRTSQTDEIRPLQAGVDTQQTLLTGSSLSTIVAHITTLRDNMSRE
jgi:hypothetical protein